MRPSCQGGRVNHEATHVETVSLRHNSGERTTQTANVCSGHFTKAADWEEDGWEVVSMRRRRL